MSVRRFPKAPCLGLRRSSSVSRETSCPTKRVRDSGPHDRDYLRRGSLARESDWSTCARWGCRRGASVPALGLQSLSVMRACDARSPDVGAAPPPTWMVCVAIQAPAGCRS